MSWIIAILLSAIVLGIYDVTKKHAVNQNAVMSTLFLATLCGTVTVVAMILLRRGPSAFQCTGREFGLVFLKGCIVSASWIFEYAAMQVMPLSLAAPIRATSPVWILLGGILLYHEIPTPLRAVGMCAIFIGYYLFAVCGRIEGFSWRGRGMIFIFLGTLLGSISALYDKYLMNTLRLDPDLVQLYFSIDLVLILGIAALCHRGITPFQWRWTIPATGIGLVLADFLYFRAVSCPESQISILALMRRSNIIISFSVGCMLFHEKNIRRKIYSLVFIIVGTVLLALC
ncbi:MAG: DMT family transporter [Victivallales bacterium]|nr:DMT family transporter [Victivallales bacterium]